MRFWWMGALLLGQVTRRARVPLRSGRARVGWFEPRNFVFLVLALVLGVGGGTKLWRGLRARRAVARLAEPDVSVEELEASSNHGRAVLTELFRIQSEAPKPEHRNAAGRALATLWKRDDLIAEEEQGLVRRGFVVSWNARRRYPRALRQPIPMSVSFGVPFLRNQPGEVGPENLEWSSRIQGAERVELETFSEWKPGQGSLAFAIHPGDFPSNGPHKLALHARVRTRGLSETWQIELPKIPFTFEFDPQLDLNAIAGTPDSTRGELITSAISLAAEIASDAEPTYSHLNDSMALRNPPFLNVRTPLPCDLSHRVEVEFEAIENRFRAGDIVVPGQDGTSSERAGAHTIRIGAIEGLPAQAITAPGPIRMRAILTADPELAWSRPDVRSIWPGTIITNWVDCRIVRR